MIRLLRYYAPYKRLIGFAVISNLLMSLFMVVSIPVLQPFLQILFNPDEFKQTRDGSGFQRIESQINGFFANLIENYGREQALMIVCIFLVVTFFGKNLFRYLSLYFLAPVRNGIVRDIRGKLVDKTLELPLSYFSEKRKGDLMSRVSADVQERVEYSGCYRGSGQRADCHAGQSAFYGFCIAPAADLCIRADAFFGAYHCPGGKNP
jgi:subfamily B ATP-binding cassette protein MsbA